MCDGCSDALGPHKNLHGCAFMGVYVMSVYVIDMYLKGVQSREHTLDAVFDKEAGRDTGSSYVNHVVG